MINLAIWPSPLHRVPEFAGAHPLGKPASSEGSCLSFVVALLTSQTSSGHQADCEKESFLHAEPACHKPSITATLPH